MEGDSPAGFAPDCCFMNRRALEQLRRSRTNVTSATGVPTLPVALLTPRPKPLEKARLQTVRRPRH